MQASATDGPALRSGSSSRRELRQGLAYSILRMLLPENPYPSRPYDRSPLHHFVVRPSLKTLGRFGQTSQAARALVDALRTDPALFEFRKLGHNAQLAGAPGAGTKSELELSSILRWECSPTPQGWRLPGRTFRKLAGSSAPGDTALTWQPSEFHKALEASKLSSGFGMEVSESSVQIDLASFPLMFAKPSAFGELNQALLREGSRVKELALTCTDMQCNLATLNDGLRKCQGVEHLDLFFNQRFSKVDGEMSNMIHRLMDIDGYPGLEYYLNAMPVLRSLKIASFTFPPTLIAGLSNTKAARSLECLQLAVGEWASELTEALVENLFHFPALRDLRICVSDGDAEPVPNEQTRVPGAIRAAFEVTAPPERFSIEPITAVDASSLVQTLQKGESVKELDLRLEAQSPSQHQLELCINLRKLRGLECLTLGGNLDDAAATVLAEWIADPECVLRGFSIKGTLSTSAIEKLATALQVNCSLRQFSLASCPVSLIAAFALGRVFGANTSLLSFDLGDCKVDDGGMVPIAHGLGKNGVLLEFHFSGRALLNVEATTLLNAIRDNRVLLIMGLRPGPDLLPKFHHEIGQVMLRNQLSPTGGPAQ